MSPLIIPILAISFLPALAAAQNLGSLKDAAVSYFDDKDVAMLIEHWTNRNLTQFASGRILARGIPAKRRCWEQSRAPPAHRASACASPMSLTTVFAVAPPIRSARRLTNGW
jgi:hypothetical protein